MRALYLFFITISASFAFSQNTQIDSLNLLTSKNNPDSNTVIQINTILKQLLKIQEYDTVVYYSNKTLKIAQTIHFKKGEASTIQKIGLVNWYSGNFDIALEKFNQAMQIYIQIKNESAIADVQNNIGLVYFNKGDYNNAITNFKLSKKSKIKLKDKLGYAKADNNLAMVYRDKGDYIEALKSYYACLKIMEELKDSILMATCYSNIGVVNGDLNNYKESLKNYQYALNIRIQMHDKKGMADTYINIGTLYGKLKKLTESEKYFNKAIKTSSEINYFAITALANVNLANIFMERKEYDQALKCAKIALDLNLQLGDLSNIALNYDVLGNAYFNLKNYQLSESYFNKALEISNKIERLDLMQSENFHLAVINELKGNYKNAYLNFKLYAKYKDSLLNEDNIKASTQIQINFENDKKEMAMKAIQDRKDVIAGEEKQKQKIISFSIILILILVGIFALFIFNRFKVTQKQKLIIELKEKETQHQKELVEEKHKEITDSINYAERIQRSFLASSNLLDENLKDYFVYFQPKDIVSGDFYWAASAGPATNKKFILVTADSTGHGVPGAIMSLLNVTSLESAIKDGYNEPADILNHTRQTIIERLKKDGSADGGKDGMDASLVCFDFKNNKITYSAANNPIWVVRQNELIELKGDKMPVGKHDKDNIPFTQHEFELNKGDIIYTLTDGFPDQFGGTKGKKFMYKQLKEILVSISKKPLVEQKETLTTILKKWMGDVEQVDDITLIGIRV